jgi:iron complex transport system permease protein
MAGLVGATLAFTGSTYQAVLRNPLADPYLIGVAAGAGLGAAIAIVADVPVAFAGFSILPLMAFVGAIIAVTLSYGQARTGPSMPVASLVLAGIAVSSMGTSITALIMLLDTERTLTILFWLLGGLGSSDWERVSYLLPYIAVSLAIALAHTRVLNVFQLGEEQARQLGVNVERTMILLLLSASLAAAAVVSLTGIIGFVGLIVPHMIRLLWGPDYRHLIPLSALLGAAFLILCDLVARSVIAPAELPIGIITALSGGPFFLYLLRRHNQRIAT